MSLPESVDIERVPRDVHTTASDDESRTRTQQSSSPSYIKRPRILSTIGSSISANNGQSSNIAERHEVREDGESKSNAHDKPEVMQRNKRLFGALMGHLGTAKRKLEEDSSTIDKQTSRQNAVAHKNGMENKRLQQLDREAADAGKSKEKTLRSIFRLRQQKADIAAALLAWKGKFIASITEVLMTESLPRICWLPSAHNEKTKKMLECHNDELIEETAKRDQSDTAHIEQIDAELECLLLRLAENSLPADISEAATLNSVDDNASAVISLEGGLVVDPGPGPALSGSELTEYMLRIRNRKSLALKADSMEMDHKDLNKQNIRPNWSLDDSAVGNGNHSGSNNFPFSAGTNNHRSMQSYSQQDTVKHTLGVNTAGRQFKENSSWDRSRDATSGSSSHRGDSATETSNSIFEGREDGEDGEENTDSINRSHQSSRPQLSFSNKLSNPRKADVAASNDARDDDSAPLEIDEGADEGEVDEEEDEAEQLLAALGGR